MRCLKKSEVACRPVGTRLLVLSGMLTAAAWLISPPIAAEQLVYTPVNPSFGGHPQNGPYLMSKAQSGKKYSMDMKFPDFGLGLMLLAQIEVNGRETLIFQKDDSIYAYDVESGVTRRTDFTAGGIDSGTLE